MTGPPDDRLLAFLEGSMDETERAELLDALDRDPELAGRLRAAAVGLDATRSYSAGERLRPETPTAPSSRASPWWTVAAAVAALVIAVPITWTVARATAAPSSPAVPAAGQPADTDPSFVLILHGRWPDAGTVEPDQRQSRAREYWEWTTSLATEGVLVAAGDLRWEPGERLGPTGERLAVGAAEVERPDFVVGMFALRVDSYEEALAVARACPHLRYGGSVSVRRVGTGFVTVDGKGDWSD